MFEYKVRCSNYPMDGQDLLRMGQEGWEMCAACTIHAADDVDKHVEKPKGMEKLGETVKYTWYFKRRI